MRSERVSLADVIAGASVAFVLIPQSLAYADLAGMPAAHGLYASALPPIAAALCASSPYLQTGPVAMTSLLAFGALSHMATPVTPPYIALAALLAFVVGVARIAFGLFRFGGVAYVMSHPVLIGFTNGAAILILASQLPSAFGVGAGDGSLLGRAVWTLLHPRAWEATSVVLTLTTLGIVLGARRLHRLVPGVLIALAYGLVFSRLTGYAGPVLGALPTGLPPVSFDLPWRELPAMIGPGLVIALIGFAEPAAIARIYAAQDRRPWNADREFVSQGLANLASALTSGFPVGSSFTRSEITRIAGGRTRWTGAVVGLVTLAFLPFANILAGLPRAILGAIVMYSAARFLRFRTLVRIGWLSRPQALVAWSTFVLSLLLAPRIDRAVMIGIGLAIIVHLWRELRVHVRAKYEHGTLRLEPKGVLFFASAPILLRAFLDELAAHPQTERIVVDLSHLGRVDLTGALALKELKREAEGAGLEVELTGAPPQSWRLIRRVMADGRKAPAQTEPETDRASHTTDDIPRSSAHGKHS
jgi:SulP family sulfate permease